MRAARRVEPVTIAVPPLTVREKHWLDSHIKTATNPKRVRFEIDPEMLNNFRSYYKHYPTYYETLI